MCDSSVERRVESYFSSMNSMARRIIIDKNTVRKSNDEQWRNIPYEQQCQLIMDSFVKAKVGEKYSYYPRSKPDVESFPKLCVRSGEKYVIDEENQAKGTGNTWRDEHSGPFTWETQSQLNLSLSENSKKEPPLPRKPPPIDKVSNAKFYKVLPTKKSMQKQNGVMFETFGKEAHDGCYSVPAVPVAVPNPVSELTPPPKQKSVNEKPETKVKSEKMAEIKASKKPVMVPVPPPSVSEIKEQEAKECGRSEPPQAAMSKDENRPGALSDAGFKVDLSPSNDPNIPKTGFDFLDDW